MRKREYFRNTKHVICNNHVVHNNFNVTKKIPVDIDYLLSPFLSIYLICIFTVTEKRYNDIGNAYLLVKPIKKTWHINQRSSI